MKEKLFIFILILFFTPSLQANDERKIDPQSYNFKVKNKFSYFNPFKKQEILSENFSREVTHSPPITMSGFVVYRTFIREKNVITSKAFTDYTNLYIPYLTNIKGRITLSTNADTSNYLIFFTLSPRSESFFKIYEDSLFRNPFAPSKGVLTLDKKKEKIIILNEEKDSKPVGIIEKKINKEGTIYWEGKISGTCHIEKEVILQIAAYCAYYF